MKDGYPVLNKDIYFAKMEKNEEISIKIENIATKKDYRVNSATAAFLELCTGTHTLNDVARILSQESGEPVEDVVKGVEKISAILQEKGLITIGKTPLEREKKTVVELQGEHRPYFAHVEITNACNLSCMHCANDSGDPYPDELTTQEILSLIDTLHVMGVTRIVCTGGEPLLHPDLYTIIEHAKKAPMIVDIFTNSTLITEEHCEKFVKLGVRKISTSIDSISEAVHDTFRGQKGALEKTLHGIGLLKETGFPVRISISLSQLNKDHIVDMIRYLGERGLTEYQVVPVKYSGRGIDNIVVSPEDYYRVTVDEYMYLKAKRPQDIPDMQQVDQCGIARDGIFIKADGTVLPCHGCSRAMGVGNVKDGNLVQLWNTCKALERLRAMKPSQDRTCAACGYLTTCAGCSADAFILEKNIRCYSPYVCASQRAYYDVFKQDLHEEAL